MKGLNVDTDTINTLRGFLNELNASNSVDNNNNNNNGGGGESNMMDNPFHAEEEEFDYLAYAQDRAMFFWGDVVQLGIVNADELPQSLRKNLRIVEY